MYVSEIVQLDCGGRQSKLAELCGVAQATVFRWVSEEMIVVNGRVYSRCKIPKKPRLTTPENWVLWNDQWYSPRVYEVPFVGSCLPTHEDWLAEQGERGRREVIDMSRASVTLSREARRVLEQLMDSCGLQTMEAALEVALGVSK